MSDFSEVSLVWRPTVVTIAAITLDASISEKHRTRVDTTDSPVEKGVDVTDHLRKKPDELTIEGIVTNYPISTNPGTGLGNSTIVVSNPDAAPGSDFQFNRAAAKFTQGRAEEAYAALLALAGSPTLILITTSLRTYDNMALTSLEVPRSSEIGSALRFTAEFKEIQIVENETIEEAVSQPSAKKKKDAGKVAATPNPNGTSIGAGLATDLKDTQFGKLLGTTLTTPLSSTDAP